MPNLSLHPVWHTLMPAYQHAVGVGTHTLSAFAFLFHGEKGKSSIKCLTLPPLHASITLVDLNFGFLASPIGLYPIPGGLCNGVLCTVLGINGHYGITLMYFTVSYVAVSVLFCLHYKFIIILAMAKQKKVSMKYRVAFRVVIFVIYSIPCFFHMTIRRNIEGGREFVQKHYPSLTYLFENPNYRAFVYDLTLYPANTIILASTTLLLMVLAIIVGSCLVFGSFYLLSRQCSSMSANTRKLQRKLVWIMLAQTLVPLTIQLSPLLVYAYSMIAVALKKIQKKFKVEV